MADPGDLPPLFLDQNEARRARASPYLRVWMTNPPPRPLPLSEGLDHCRHRFHLTLHCITAIHKSPKSLAIVTAKGKADNRVDSTVCVSHKQGNRK